MAFLYNIAFAPNIACTPPCTSNTPVAPIFLSLFLSTLEMSFIETLSLVMQASISSIFSIPPKAATTSFASSFILDYVVILISLSSSSSFLPGVGILNLVIKTLNTV